jgi:putative solute:sodium symporter small subunit
MIQEIARREQRVDVYWRRTRLFTFWMLTAWFAMTFFAIFFARELSDFTLFGWPFPFYMAAQGLILIYLLILAWYAKHMQRLDRGMKSEDADAR